MTDVENKNLNVTNPENANSPTQTNSVESKAIHEQNNNTNVANEAQSGQDFTKIFSEKLDLDSDTTQDNTQEQPQQSVESNTTETINNNTTEIQKEPTI